MSSSTESRKLRNEILLKRFAGTIAKFEKTLADLKKDGMTRMKVDIKTTEYHKPVCRRPPSATENRAAGRRAAAKCVSAAPPADSDLMRKRRNVLEMERKNLKRREAIHKKREAARREILQMRNTSGMYDPSELVHDLEKMLGYSITGHMPQPALPLPDCYISCCEDEKRVLEVEEGEIID